MGLRVIRASVGRRVIALALVLACVGCERRAVNVREHVKASTVELIARRIEGASAAGPEELGQLFDWDELARRSVPPSMTGPRAEEFAREVRQDLEQSAGSSLLAQIRQSRYTFRGVAWRDGRPVARFRLNPPTGGFNVHDIVLARAPGAEPRIVDVHVVVTSEYLSETMQRMWAMLGADHSVLARLLGAPSATAHQVEEMRRFFRLVQEGRPAEALATYATLPEGMRRARPMMLMRVTAASRVNDDTRYLAILDEVAEALGDDPAVAIMMLDAYFLRGQWSECLRTLEQVRRATELRPPKPETDSGARPDPFLDAFEARVHCFAGDAERSLSLADRAIAAEPDLMDGHDVALLAALDLGQVARARAELEILERDFAVDPAELAAQEGYEGVTALLSPAAQ